MGSDLFKAAARMFVDEHPPASPVLLDYGEGFAAFLAGLELIDDMPHMVDIARLEWLMHAARNAADALPLRADDLAAIAAERHGGADIRLYAVMRAPQFRVRGVLALALEHGDRADPIPRQRIQAASRF